MIRDFLAVCISIFVFSNIALSSEQYPAGEIESKAAIGTGYNKLSHTFLPSCFETVETTSPSEVEEALIMFQNDLSEDYLRNKLDLEFSLSIPIYESVTLKPKFVFSRDAAVTTLSHTSTYLANASLGQRKIVPYQQNRLVLKPQFRRYFDSAGRLNNAYEFIRLCGDEFINTQNLGSKLLITAKISFLSKEDKLYFEGDLGVSPNLIPSWTINAKIKNLTESQRKRLRMDFYAIQIGGQPERLIGAMGSHKCRLDQLEECQAILDRLHDYAANDYSKQLVATNLDRWSIESIKSLPYYLSDIYDQDGQKLSFDMISTPEILDRLDEIKIAGQKHSIKELNNYQTAKMMLQTEYLATDEIATLNQITKISAENLQRLTLFGYQCYKDLQYCISLDTDYIFSYLIYYYDASLLDTNIGELISKVYAKANTFFWEQRASENFAALQPALRNNVYSSYYVKFKDLNNYLITNPYATVDIKCDTFFLYTPTLFKNAFQFYEILHPQMELNYKAECNDSAPLFVANPNGIADSIAPESTFIVELWGRK